MTVTIAVSGVHLIEVIFLKFSADWCLVSAGSGPFFRRNSVCGETGITSERHFFKDPIRASLLALAKSIY